MQNGEGDEVALPGNQRFQGQNEPFFRSFVFPLRGNFSPYFAPSQRAKQNRGKAESLAHFTLHLR